MRQGRVTLDLSFQDSVKFSIVEGQYWLAPASAMSLVGFSIALEWPTIIKENKMEIVLANLHLFVASAFMGLLVNYVSFLVVQTTSSITLKILNTDTMILTDHCRDDHTFLSVYLTRLTSHGVLVFLVPVFWCSIVLRIFK